MGHSITRISRARLGVGALAVVATAVAALVVGTAPASARASVAGAAFNGSASYTKAGVQVTVAPLAPCSVAGPISATTPGISVNGAKFGSGSSSCTTTVVDPNTSTTQTKSHSENSQFELSALVLLGGDRVRINNYKVDCVADEDGTTASWSIASTSGLGTLPRPVPQNYVRELDNLIGTPLATITFNEISFPGGEDGSIALTLAHVRFLPASGMSGEILVGNTACAPTP
ncbi:hypothetical protein [Actinokineospora enzanensis]|uniref:hypothetical protein n=1 Tax=Actinokineospora enzanensis TaxID=155975 RepID=UPI00037515E6|nr:hypothetical protein [Actinokineospora enzanensis]